MNIKSLKRINEGSWKYVEDPYDIRYKKDIEAANKAYDEVAGKPGFLGIRSKWSKPWSDKAQIAAADRDRAIELAKKRREAAKQGMIPQEDYDEIKYQEARTKALARMKNIDPTDHKSDKVDSDTKSGIFRSIGKHLSDHPIPYVAGATVAGLAGLLALQKRKERLPEPGRY